jgi:CheY-like chemotaxis protein
MSLVGNLEDLGLGEILQIVSLSRKSGHLSLISGGREGKIVFRHGQVVRASSSSFRRNMGEILVEKGVIDKGTLEKALATQQRMDSRERLGSVLVKQFGADAEVIDDVVREQIEKIVYSLFTWSEGTFDFELQDNDVNLDVTSLDPLQFRLDQGLNPQFLAIEGSRIVDEMRHRGEPVVDGDVDEYEDDDSAHEANVDLAFDLLQQMDEAPEAAVDAGLESRLVVLVDDDGATRDSMERLLGEKGYSCSPFEKSEDALIYIDTVYRAGRRPAVLVDLIMPRMDGSGILGGLELLELIHTNFQDLRVLAVADYNNTDAERTVREMGYPFLVKPRKSSLDDAEAMRSFGLGLFAELKDFFAGRIPEDSSDTVNLGDELRLEMGEEPVSRTETEERSTGISLLRGILAELNNPALGGGITLLVLRFASEFMNRAVIFIVKQDEVAGLGQFGIVDAPGKADARVRNIRIPLNEESPFRQAVESQMALKYKPDVSQWNTYLFDRLAGGVPDEYFLGPIISEGKVVALLYGDNLPEKRKIGDTDSLEIFLSQAGMAMEKALLQRRLKEKNQEGN